MTNYRYNPFLGNLDKSSDQTGDLSAVSVTVTYDCDVGAAVEDIVVLSQTTDNKVESLTSNIYTGLAIGQIVEKPTTTTAKVQVIGILAVTGASFSKGNPVFIDATGNLTTTVPTTGSIQVMGTAISATDYMLLPMSEKTTLV